MDYHALEQITEHVSVENVFANPAGKVLTVPAGIVSTLAFHHEEAKFVLVKVTVFVVNANVSRKTVADTLANTARNAQLVQANARNIPHVFSVKYLNLEN